MVIWKRERIREADRHRVEEGGESQLPDLPQEIIADILLRLPAKSLGRFRSVSKLFLFLLSDPRFTKSHLDRSLQNGPFRAQNQRLILSSHNLYSVGYESIREKGDGNGCLMGFEMDYPLKHKSNLFSQLTKQYAKRKLHKCRRSFDDDVDEYPIQVNIDSIYKRNWVDIKGSCNGLVCISPAESVHFLFNPTTGEWKRVPDLPEILRSDEEYLDAYGFGYDSVNDDYKLVKLDSACDVACSVYSLRRDSWEGIGVPPYSYGDRFHSSGVLLNGAIHWVFSRIDDYQNYLIAAFDLSKDEFWDMPVPDEVDDCPHRFRDFTIGVLNDSLCIIYSCNEMHDDIWLMREYGVANSWTRLRIGVCYKHMIPLCSDKNGEMLVQLNGKLVLYNFKNPLSREIKICGVEFTDGFEAETYVESLISPVLYGRD